MHLFSLTVNYSVSPSSNPPFDPLRSEEPHQFHVVPDFWHICYIS